MNVWPKFYCDALNVWGVTNTMLTLYNHIILYIIHELISSFLNPVLFRLFVEGNFNVLSTATSPIMNE